MIRLECVLAALLPLAVCAESAGGSVRVRFEDGACSVSYAADRALLQASEYMRRCTKNYQGGTLDTDTRLDEPVVDMPCSSSLFCMMVELFEGQPLGSISTRDVVGMLAAADFLLIDADKGDEFYKGLAEASTFDKGLGEEVVECANIVSTRIYMLKLLRKRARMHRLRVSVSEGVVTLYENYMDTERKSADGADAMKKMKTLEGDFSMAMEEEGLILLKAFVRVMSIDTLRMKVHLLNRYVVRQIGEIECVKRLYVHCTELLFSSTIQSLRGSRILLGLRIECGREYETRLSKDDMEAIGSMVNLAELDISKLRVEGRHLACLRKLKSLERLALFAEDAGDVETIGGMEELAELDIRYKTGSLAHDKVPKSLRRLVLTKTQLDAGSVSAIGSMSSLEELEIRECGIDAQSFASLLDLKSLERLRIEASSIHVSGENMLNMGGMNKLAELEIVCSSMDTGSLAHLRGLKDLARLVVTVMPSESDMAAIESMAKLEELEIRYSNEERGNKVCFQCSKGLTKLEIRGEYGRRNAYYVLEKRDIALIGTMASLEELEIHKCDIDAQSLASFLGLKRLKRLRIDASSIHVDGENILDTGGMSKLAELEIVCSSMEAGNLAHLRGLENVERLRIEGYNIHLNGEDVSFIGSMPRLRRLEIEDCEIEAGSLAGLQSRGSLEILKIRGGHEFVLGKEDASGIGRVESLRVLEIKCRSIEAGGLAHLSGLKVLARLRVLTSWCEGQLSKEDMSGIGKVKSLGELVVACRSVEAQALAHLSELPRLVVLVIEGIATDISKEDMSLIGEARGLKVLVISSCNVEAESLVRLSKLQCLARLCMRVRDRCPGQMAGSDMEAVGKMVNLRELNIWGYRLEAGCLARICSLEHLRVLEITSEGALNKEDSAALKSMNRLTVMNIAYYRDAGTEIRIEGRGTGSSTKIAVYCSGALSEDEMEAVRILRG